MQVGELSARTGATVRMLHYYEEQGLLKPQRTASGYRVYAEADVDRVARIRCMLSAALPSGVVATALKFLLDGHATIPELPEERARLADMLDGELGALTEKIEALRHSRDLLAQIAADVRTAVVGPDRPGDPGTATVRTSVSKTAPAVGASRGRQR
jgi:DNA-binding transcriptional MerR regulator